ncbi:MAG TPA: hypothetical protein VNK23_00550 [Candidatus Dormibacteraeota bacterium]|nr:hypothetical protein [Candidatus Dormibacteraeota bacterium]
MSVCILVISVSIVASGGASAQLPPVQSPPGWGQVPQGTGACSVGKSCADLAPGMIRGALGASPVANNARAFAAILSSHTVASTANARAAEWAVEAFRRAGADEVHIEKFGASGQFENVVAEIRGRDKPQDYVLFVAVLGDPGTDSLLAAEKAAVLIDAVRVIHNTGNIPRRSIRFVLFVAAPARSRSKDAHLAGVWAYVRAHRAHLERIAAAVSLGQARGAIDGFSLEARADTIAAVRQAFVPLRSLGIRNFTQLVRIPSATTPFWLEGIPTLVATRAKAPPNQAAHGSPKTQPAEISSAVLRGLKRRVAVAAVAAYALADAETRIGPRQSRAKVEESITSMKLMPKLRRSADVAEWKSVDALNPN